MAAIRSFQDLRIWHEAIELAPAVYGLLRFLPREEAFALASQIRRAVVSVAANIAEGQARLNTKEFIQHLGIARGSLAELATLLTIAGKLGYVEDAALQPTLDRVSALRRPQDGMIASLRQRQQRPPTPPAH